jgi:DNA transformation protein and related proteins
MAVSSSFLAYVIEQLAGLGRVRSKRMFGGVGLYCDEWFFGLLDDDVLYLKVDASNRDDFAARGMKPFQPFRDKPEYSMSYYQVPAETIEDAEDLVRWARKAVRVAAGARAKPPRRRSRSPARP